jgi:hypothetical protein
VRGEARCELRFARPVDAGPPGVSGLYGPDAGRGSRHTVLNHTQTHRAMAGRQVGNLRGRRIAGSRQGGRSPRRVGHREGGGQGADARPGHTRDDGRTGRGTPTPSISAVNQSSRTRPWPGPTCARPATTTVGTVSPPSSAAVTTAAPSGARQMPTPGRRRSRRPGRRRTRRRGRSRRRRRYVQPGRRPRCGVAPPAHRSTSGRSETRASARSRRTGRGAPAVPAGSRRTA